MTLVFMGYFFLKMIQLGSKHAYDGFGIMTVQKGQCCTKLLLKNCLTHFLLLKKVG
jgi:hypothetical protein